jgi:hypothetical protein
MEAGLLFILAHRTSACQRILTRSAGYFNVSIPGVRVCVRRENMNGAISRLLKQYPMVFVVGAAPGPRPECAGPIFNTLRVPPDENGEPKGILRLRGAEKTGYLVESVSQAIILLPDDPYEILRMAPPTFARLKRKFVLPGEFPRAGHPDYEKLITACMEQPEPTENSPANS